MTDNHGNRSASSSSSLNSSSHDTEDDHTIAAILAEDERLRHDGKLGKRLSHLDSIPHTPRVIGDIPDPNDATLDHERLAERKSLLDLLFLASTKASGNRKGVLVADVKQGRLAEHCIKRLVGCVIVSMPFTHLAIIRLTTYGLAELQMEEMELPDQLFQSPDYHKYVRKEVVKQLKRHRRLYESYVPMKYKHYLKKMKRLGEWGDHVTLQAAADRFEAKICLVTSFRDTCYIEILPKDKNPLRAGKSQRLVPLSFLSLVRV
ncbi:OVARIAN TUMOR DOMAIN-containing deubiquitinating enzyme 11 [Sesamum angolense]|uniref:OVARIAN TUMOR DOMAIN-containing deubiquitinating enzyme 11 n=1 Tax=Sesamum angolense TaxID=2727404 RepID=A0AAE1WRH4_9LAMI|nr:OVARIAN TUMOR DOMAIN-containing deubiquitinating enzyme 11 [Sesamum angolense]